MTRAPGQVSENGEALRQKRSAFPLVEFSSVNAHTPATLGRCRLNVHFRSGRGAVPGSGCLEGEGRSPRSGQEGGAGSWKSGGRASCTEGTACRLQREVGKVPPNLPQAGRDGPRAPQGHAMTTRTSVHLWWPRGAREASWQRVVHELAQGTDRPGSPREIQEFSIEGQEGRWMGRGRTTGCAGCHASSEGSRGCPVSFQTVGKLFLWAVKGQARV